MDSTGGATVSTSALAADASTDTVSHAVFQAASSFLPQLSDVFLDVSVTRELIRSGAWGTRRFTIQLSLDGTAKKQSPGSFADVSESSFSSVSGSRFLLKTRDDIPTLALDASSVTGTDVLATLTETSRSAFGQSGSRFLLSVTYPTTPSVTEIQSIVCQAQGPMPARGPKNPPDFETFRVSFRGYHSKSIWVFDYLQPSQMPPCNPAAKGDGYQCMFPNRTMLHQLLDLPSLPNATLSSNSTTGRICPSATDIDSNGHTLVFLTNITFLEATTPVPGKILGGSIGDVPPLFLQFSNITAGTLSSMSKQQVRGSAPLIREVQMLTLQQANATNPVQFVGSFHLQYKSVSRIVSVNASELEFAAATSMLLGVVSGVEVSRSSSSFASSSGQSITWTITFPSRFGRANLLSVASFCNATGAVLSGYQSSTSEQLLLTSTQAQLQMTDSWSGSSCFLPFLNVITSTRIVSGFSSLTGSLALAFHPRSAATSDQRISSPLSSLADGLSAAIKSEFGQISSLASVTEYSFASRPNQHILMVDLGDESAWSAFSGIDVDSSGLTEQYTMCAAAFSTINRFGTLTQETPCAFPFVHGGVQYSQCISSVEVGSKGSFCSATYDLDGDQLWGLCVPCGSTMPSSSSSSSSVAAVASDGNNLLFASIVPFVPTARWEGSLDQLTDVLANVVYLPSDASRDTPTLFPGSTGLTTAPSFSVSDTITAVVYDKSISIKSIPPASLDVPVYVSWTKSPPCIMSSMCPLMAGTCGSSASGGAGGDVYVFEDVDAFVTGISVGMSCSMLQQQSGGLSDTIVGVSLEADHGELYVSTYEGVQFVTVQQPTDAASRNLTLIGPIGKVNVALASLTYRPIPNWNSVEGSSSPTTVKTIQRIVLMDKFKRNVQVISTAITGSGSIIINSPDSYFVLTLNCLQLARSLMSSNASTNNSTHSSLPTNMTAISDHILSNANATFVQTEINSMLKKCLRQFSVGLLPTSQLIETIVTRSIAQPTSGGNSFVWAVEFLIPAMPSLVYGFPVLTVVQPSNLKSLGSTATATAKVDRPALMGPAGQFRVGFGGMWTPLLDADSSANDVVAALQQLTTINTNIGAVSGSKDYIKNGISGETEGFLYDITFHHDVDWIPNPFDLSSALMPTDGNGKGIMWRPAFGPMASLQINGSSLIGNQITASVTTISQAVVARDILRVVMSDLSQAAGGETFVTAQVSLYVLPTPDPPMVMVGPDLTAALQNMTEDGSLIFEGGVSIASVGDVSDSAKNLLSLIVVSPHANVSLLGNGSTGGWIVRYIPAATMNAQQLVVVGNLTSINQVGYPLPPFSILSLTLMPYVPYMTYLNPP